MWARCPRRWAPPLTLFPGPTTSAARVGACPWSELCPRGWRVPVIGEGPPGEAGLPMLFRHWRLPTIPADSADLAIVHVVVIRPVCHGPEIARRGELPRIGPPVVPLLVAFVPVPPREEMLFAVTKLLAELAPPAPFAVE
eukprot:9219487-Pyramimonas_sp.AAC.1